MNDKDRAFHLAVGFITATSRNQVINPEAFLEQVRYVEERFQTLLTPLASKPKVSRSMIPRSLEKKNSK